MRLRCCSADVVDDVVLTEPSDAAVGGQPVSCDHPPVEQESDAPAEDDAPEDSALVTKRWHVYPSHVESDHKAAKAAELLAALRAEPGLDEWRWYFDDAAVLRRFLTARDDNVAKAKALLLDALAWRRRRRPHVIDYAEMERESRTGKLRVAEWQRLWDRLLNYSMGQLVILGAVVEPDVGELLLWTAFSAAVGARHDARIDGRTRQRIVQERGVRGVAVPRDPVRREHRERHGVHRPGVEQRVERGDQQGAARRADGPHPRLVDDVERVFRSALRGVRVPLHRLERHALALGGAQTEVLVELVVVPAAVLVDGQHGARQDAAPVGARPPATRETECARDSAAAAPRAAAPRTPCNESSRRACKR